MRKESYYFSGMPIDLSFKCKKCGASTKANINNCSSCKDTDPFYFGEIKRLTGGTNNIIIIIGILGAFIFLISFFIRFSGLYLLIGIAMVVYAETMKYNNNKQWFFERERIIDKQRSNLVNFEQWNTIVGRIITKEKDEFISQWIIKQANEKIPKPK